MRHNTSELAQLVAEGLDCKCLEPYGPLPSCWPHISKDIPYFRDVDSMRFVSDSEVLGTNVWTAFLTGDDDGSLFFSLAIP